MYQIPLTATANQTLSLNLDGAFWQLHVYQSATQMCMDISINGNPAITGVRCFAGQGVMPYSYMYSPNYGNFIFDNIPDWTNFGSNCSLWYMSAAEFASYETAVLSNGLNLPSLIINNLPNWGF